MVDLGVQSRRLDGSFIATLFAASALHDVGKVASTIDALVGAGANDVGNVNFTVEHPSKLLDEAREKALKIVDQANRRSNEIIEEARATAIAEGQRLVGDARQEVQLEQARARDALRKDVATLAVAGASKLLEREIDPKAHADLIEKLAREIEGAKA